MHGRQSRNTAGITAQSLSAISLAVSSVVVVPVWPTVISGLFPKLQGHPIHAHVHAFGTNFTSRSVQPASSKVGLPSLQLRFARDPPEKISDGCLGCDNVDKAIPETL